MKKLSIKSQILYLFLLGALVPSLLIGIFSYFSIASRLTNQELNSKIQISSLIAQNISQKTDYYNELTKFVYYNDNLLQYLNKASHKRLDLIELYEFQQVFSSCLRTDKYIRGAYLYTQHGQFAYWNEGYSSPLVLGDIDPDFLQAITESEGRSVFSRPETNVNLRYSVFSGNMILYGRTIHNTKDNFEPVGLLILEIDLQSFDDCMKTTAFDQSTPIVLVDDDQYVIWTYNDNQEIFPLASILPDPLNALSETSSKIYFQETSYYCLSEEIPQIPLRCLVLIPQSSILSVLLPTAAFYALLIGFNMAAILFLFVFINRYIIRPIKKLSVKMNEMNYEQRPQSKPRDLNNEIGFLYKSFDDLHLKTYDLLEQVKMAAIHNSEQEIKLLHSQLNPHFLYNTLDSLNWMVKQKGCEEDASQMIISLSHILRYSIKNVSGLVTLQEELNWLKHYIFIQKKRFGDLFTIRYSIDESLLCCKTHKFILQPFVENAILHGFSEIHTGGIIQISIAKDPDSDNRLRVQITDNGKGMNQNQISYLFHGRDNGLGIKNIHEILSSKYGPDCGIFIHSKLGCYTCVTVIMPLL